MAAKQLLAEGKTVKILTVGKKGRESLKREFGDLACRPCGFVGCETRGL